MKYEKEGSQLVIIAGKDYGSGSSRDWAAKGPWLLVSFFVNCYVNFSIFHFRLIKVFFLKSDSMSIL